MIGAQGGAGHQLKVVLVEDDTVARLQLKRLLTRFGAMVIIEAKNGEEGLATILREVPDLVFCDLSMPVMDGIAMIEAVRAQQQFATLPIIAISASKDKETVLRLIEMGIADYLIKPIPLESTFHRLRRLLPGLLPGLRGPAASRGCEETIGDKP